MALRLRRTRPRHDDELVRLRPAGLPEVHAAVRHRVEGGLSLELAPGGPLPARALHRRTCLLVGEGPDAEPREVLVLAAEDARGRLQDGVVHAVWAEGGPQRRAFFRVPAFRPVVLVPELRGLTRPRELRGVTRDVSAGGALVGGEAAAALNPGERLRVELQLDDAGTPLRGAGRVLRVGDGRNGAAVRLDVLLPAERDRLLRWVRERERDALERLRSDAL